MMHSLRLRLILVTAVLPMAAMAVAGLLIRDANGRTLAPEGTFSLFVGDPPGAGVLAAEPVSGAGFVQGWASSEMAALSGLPVAGEGEACEAACTRAFDGADVEVWPVAGTAIPFVYSAPAGDQFIVAAAPGFAPAFAEGQEASLYELNLRVAGAIGGAGLVCGLVGFVASQRILRPVSELTRAARLLESGELDRRVREGGRDEIGQLAHAFNSMAASLSRNEALRRSMTSDVAHELRTPLNNISGFIDLLADGLVEPDERVLSTLQEETQLLVGLVDDLAQLSLGDAGALQLHPEPVDVAMALERTVHAMSARAAEAGVAIDLVAEQDVGESRLDRQRFDQVMRNLVENAIRHAGRPGIVRIAAAVSAGTVVVKVEDSGNGIPPEHLPFIFERFYRADASRNRQTGGSGLGLAIARQLVEAHEGTIVADNRAGGGARFTVNLPRL